MNAPHSASLAQLRAPAEQPQPRYTVGLTDSQGFELAQRAAKCLAASSLVPKEYQGNIANCVIALNIASRVGADPLMVMQNLVIVHGRPTWSAQFLIATVNTCGRFSALRYEFFGEVGTDTWGCRAYAVEKATGDKLVGTDVTIAIAKSEGWYGKNGSKWKTIPQQMLIYRAASWWTRAYAPELSMGLQTADERADIIDYNTDGSFTVTTEELRADQGKMVDLPVEPPADSRAMNPAPAEFAEPAQDASTDAAVYDVLFKQITGCTDPDVLDILADETRSLADTNQQAKLQALITERRAALAG